MKTIITYEDVKKIACYDPKELGAKEGDQMPVLDFIKNFRNRVKEKEDIIWVVCREDYMTPKELRLFAVWCAREALKLVENPDPRSIEAVNVAERYANGEATKEELAAARDAIRAANAAWDAARGAANAARDAAWDAAWDAARDAARDAANAARDAANAARDAARDAQIDELIRIIESR